VGLDMDEIMFESILVDELYYKRDAGGRIILRRIMNKFTLLL
jgi:hypothetical protein